MALAITDTIPYDDSFTILFFGVPMFSIPARITEVLLLEILVSLGEFVSPWLKQGRGKFLLHTYEY
jgi:hypothetical protein